MFFRSIVLVLFLGVVTPLLVAQNDATDKTEEKGEKVNPFFERLVAPDRNLQRRYEQAERLLQAERYAEAGQLLGSILESQADFLLPPPPDSTERTTSQTFDAEILQKIAELPEAGRNSYKLQYETLAQRLLTEAVECGSLEGIQVVAQNYFPTAAGIDATFLLGMSQFEQGAPGSAMFTLRKLLRRGLDVDAHEPTLSLTLATCQLRFGMNDDAKETLERFLKRFPTPSILLSGNEPWTPKNVDDLLDGLCRSLRPPRPLSDWIERTGWLLGFGTPTQNPSTPTEKPLLELLWQVPTLGKADNYSEARLLQTMVRRSADVYLPAGQPLVVDNRLILRGMYETTAIDVRTGKRLWRSADADYRLPTSIASPFRNFAVYGGYAPSSRFALRILLWHDRISHGMSSDGKRLFTVEGLELTPYGPYSPLGRGQRNIQIGNKTVEDPRARPGNSLVARDVRTGQVLWRAGKYPLVQKLFDQYAEELETKNKPEQSQPNNNAPVETSKDSGAESTDAISEEERFLGEAWFLGPPLPLFGRLNVIGENAGMLRLFVLDAKNGKLIRQQPLLQPSLPFENDYLRRYYGLMPSAANGILYCPTGLGMVVALDATTAAPLWCFSYLTPPKEIPNVRNNFRNSRFFYSPNAGNDEFRSMFSQTGWQFPCLIVEGNRLLVAPPDVPALYCLDAATGKLLWQNENLQRQDTLYVACVRNGKVYVVTPISMLALSLESGESLWQNALASIRSEQQFERPTSRPSSRVRRVVPTNQGGNAANSARPALLFPRGVVPSGLGVHNDGRYFLPLSDGTVAVVDLDKGTFETIAPLPTFLRSGPSLSGEGSGSVLRSTVPPFPFDGEVASTPRQNNPAPTFASSRNDTTLGNLVGLQGLFFSQAPLRITCFDQFETLKKKTEKRLADDPNDPAALTQLGRIRRAEENIPEAISLFRRSLGQKKSELTAILLRETLLEAIRTDYAAWSSAAAELEALADFPEELGEILLVLAQGALKVGKSVEFLDTVTKSFELETSRTIRIPVEEGVVAQLNRAFGSLVERQSGTLSAPLEQVAEELYGRLMAADATNTMSRVQLPWWESLETSSLSPELRRWQLFLEYFHSLPIAAKARETLLSLYEKNKRFSAMESMLNLPVRWFPLGLDLPTINAAANEDAEPAFFGEAKDATAKSPTMTEIRRFAELLESQENAADAFYYYRQLALFHADERDGTLSGKELYEQALCRPLLKRYYEREIAAKNWPEGVVEFPDAVLPIPPTPGIAEDNNKERLARLLRTVQQRDRRTTAQVPVPLLGTYEPFHSAYTYSLETIGNDSSLVCYDTLGTVRWRCDLSSLSADIQQNAFFSDQSRGMGFQQMFLKACNHYLLFVRRNTIIALDTFHASDGGTPTVLWTKNLTSLLLAKQNFTAVRLYEVSSRQQFYSPMGYMENVSLGESVHVLPNVVCYRDADLIYGLDPTTGETRWTRDIPSFRVTILSDRNHLFLFSSDTNQVLALDPGSGKELARGTTPKDAFFAYETNLIGLSQPTGRMFRLFVCDVRDVFKSQRERALLVSTDYSEGDSLPTIAPKIIQDNLNGDTIVRFVNHNRFLATLPRQETILRIYDLKEKTDWFGEQQVPNGWRIGVKLALLQPEVRNANWDLDIELIDGNPLVLFIENPNVAGTPKPVTEEDGRRLSRSRGPLNNVPSRSVGLGTLMFYDRDGKKLWNDTVKVENWHRLAQAPSGLPVILFAVSTTDQPHNGQPAEFGTGLFGIDKRTGKTRLYHHIPQAANQQNSLLQGFRTAVDPERYEMTLNAPFRTLTIRFTDKEPPPKPPAPPKKPFDIMDHLPFAGVRL